jgi:hypothetical protein
MRVSGTTPMTSYSSGAKPVTSMRPIGSASPKNLRAVDSVTTIRRDAGMSQSSARKTRPLTGTTPNNSNQPGVTYVMLTRCRSAAGADGECAKPRMSALNGP